VKTVQYPLNLHPIVCQVDPTLGENGIPGDSVLAANAPPPFNKWERIRYDRRTRPNNGSVLRRLGKTMACGDNVVRTPVMGPNMARRLFE
jgi:hypothetical protein